MKLRPYQIGDECCFQPRADFLADFAADGGQVREGPKFTLMGEGGAVRGVAGLTRLAHHAWGAWALMPDLSPREWVAAGRWARTVCVWATALHPRGRIYAVPADTDAARRLLAYAGFRPSPDDLGEWRFEPQTGG
ncbi:MAG: hypothetical protein DI570_18930 [Phenylobacterium zucineum]|nr:MAG: hypothetical protein DI570_18930 [Phenylobacterium zucineum]